MVASFVGFCVSMVMSHGKIMVRTRVLGYDHTLPDSLVSEQAVRGALATSLEFEFHLQFPCSSPSTELSDSANQRDAETSANVSKHWKTRAKDNDVITYDISANQHFASTFSMQILKFQRRSCKLSFFFPPRRQSAPESLLPGYG